MFYTLLTAATTDASQQGSGFGMLSSLIVVVIFFGIMWLLIIRPQKKQQKEQEEMIAQLKPGASIMTTGGFYGVVLDIVDDTVIVEFGNNKNCRIPMNKAAIAQVDKPEAEVKEEEAAEEDGKEKKKLSLGKKKED